MRRVSNLLLLLLAGCADPPAATKIAPSMVRAVVAPPAITLSWTNSALGFSAAQMSTWQTGVMASGDLTNWAVVWLGPWTNHAVATIPATNQYQFYRAFAITNN